MGLLTMLSPSKTMTASLFLLALLFCSVFLVAANGQLQKPRFAASNADLVYGNAANAGNDTNVILLGWDGVQRNHLFELLNAGLMPNLSGFIQTGKMVNVTVYRPLHRYEGWVDTNPNRVPIMEYGCLQQFNLV